MFRVDDSRVSEDWYEDGHEGGENLYRLDFVLGEANAFQVQLFLPTVVKADPESGYINPRVFIERDNRIPGGDARVDYACGSWPLTEAEALALLYADEAGVVGLLTYKVGVVVAMPNDRAFIRKYAGRELAAVEAYWASLDGTPV